MTRTTQKILRKARNPIHRTGRIRLPGRGRFRVAFLVLSLLGAFVAIGALAFLVTPTYVDDQDVEQYERRMEGKEYVTPDDELSDHLEPISPVTSDPALD